ncbi:hypothetical protein C2E23DRAFT_868446 [Lenzites betulinus]|nr:hypothetical protein C2E23DRAFT_868446 [Lenzites betulinus]
MRAFIKCLLGYDPLHKNVEGGILGVVKAYYGCVEAQGRGTLHCHMMVWIEGGLNPSDLKARLLGDDGEDFGRRLVSFLDDTISNELPRAIPGNPPEIRRRKPSKKPLSSRGFDLHVPPDDPEFIRRRNHDLRLLVACCQHHRHTGTCYKYVKEGEPNKCRFEMEENKYVPETTINSETGELSLRCLDGLINNFNATIIEAMRCNMDLQFIGTGEDAKAVIYYITDYITKSQLKTHVAYAALALGVKKAAEGNTDSEDSDLVRRAKKTLQKCAFSLLANQELSAQQVSASLMGFDDHFTSDEFSNLYWPAFERYLEHDLEMEIGEGSGNATEAADHEPAEQSHNEDNAEDDQTYDTVGVSTDRNGNLIPISDQLSDYLYRGHDLDTVCVWDFIAQTQKITLKSQRVSGKLSWSRS